MKNPFKLGDHVVVTGVTSSYNGDAGYISLVSGDNVRVAFSKEKSNGYHYTHLSFFNEVYPEAPKQYESRNESVWCIFRASGEPPKKMHSSYDVAKAELEKLAKANSGNTFYLLEAIEELTYELKYERKELKYNQYPQEPEEDTTK